MFLLIFTQFDLTFRLAVDIKELLEFISPI